MELVTKHDNNGPSTQQTRQRERSLSRLFTVTALSILSSQALALNLVPNPGIIGVGTTVTINPGETLDSGELSISGLFENYGTSSDAQFHVLSNGKIHNYGFLTWGVGGTADQVDAGATVINEPTGIMVFGALSSSVLDWQGGGLRK